MNSHKTLQKSRVGLFDAQGHFSIDKIKEVLIQFSDIGAVHITNTGLADASTLLPLLPPLGFSSQEQFSAGGRTTKLWQTKWAAAGLRYLDYYPPHLHLLPNNEIGYQRDFPRRILFFCTLAPVQGGRTFLHSAKNIENLLLQIPTGKALLKKIMQYGLMIETGFLDARHPEKKNNYFQSWQERFGSQDENTALKTAQSLHREYDACWWREDSSYKTLMTRITLPGFSTDKLSGLSYLRFPRIAMDPPVFLNGFRRFPLGNEKEFSENEKSLLRTIYHESQEGFEWKSGDIILMDNIRYGHSREPFKGSREVLIGMAGMETAENPQGEKQWKN